MRWGLALATALFALAIPASALAQAPDNLVRNGDEGPLVSPTGYHYIDSWPFWAKSPAGSGVVPVLYGAPGFPSKELSARIGGGDMFFAGGPSRPGDDNSAKDINPIIYQVIYFNDAQLQLIRSGNEQITVAGCLGGYADQDDWASIDGIPRLYEEDRSPGGELDVPGPKAAERGNKTDLLPRSGTMPLQPGVAHFTVGIHFHRTSGQNTYNDAYADKISAWLTPKGTPPPEAECSAPKQVPPPGKKNPPKRDPTPKDPDDGSNTTVPLTRVSKRVAFGKRYATFKLHCTPRDTSCHGTVTLKTKTSKVGSAHFRIATGQTGTVKVKLGRKWRTRVAHLPKRRFARLKLTAVVRIGAEKTSFSFGAIR